MEKPEKDTKYVQPGTAIATNDGYCPYPLLSLDETSSKCCFPTSDVSRLNVTTPYTHPSPELGLPSSVPFTDRRCIPPQAVHRCNNGNVLINQGSMHNKEGDLKVVCSVLSLGVTTPIDEISSEAVTNTSKIENALRFPDSEKSLKQANGVVEDLTEMISDTDKRTLETSKPLKLGFEKKIEGSAVLENSSSTQINEVTVVLDNYLSFPETSTGSLNTSMTVPPHRESMNGASFNSGSSGSLIKKSTPPSRFVRQAHGDPENPKSVAPFLSVSSLRVEERRKVGNTTGLIASEKLEVKASTRLRRQSSSMMADNNNQPASFMNIIKRKTNIPVTSPRCVVGPVERGLVTSHDGGLANSGSITPAVRLIPLKSWQLISSKWYRCHRKKLGRGHRLLKRRKTKVRRLHRRNSPPNGSGGHRTRVAMTEIGRQKTSKLQADKLEASFSARKKWGTNLESEGRKSLSVPSNPPRSPLPLSSTRVGVQGDAPTVAMSLQERLILRKQQQQSAKGLGLSGVNQPPSGRTRAETTCRSALHSPSAGAGTPLTASDKASAPPHSATTLYSRHRSSIPSPIVSARTSASGGRPGWGSCPVPPPRSLSAGPGVVVPGPAREKPEAAKFVIIPHLSSAEERDRTATVVFDLDETLCNNRVAGPPLLRPGAAQLLQDIRARYGRPRYRPTPFAATRTAVPSHDERPGVKFARSVVDLAICNDAATYPSRGESGLRVELVLWTASVQSAAKRVLDRIDPRGDIFDQIIYQDSRWYSSDKDYTKDLRLLGRNMSNVVIVENAPASVKCNPRNAILVTDFSHNQLDRQLLVVRSILMEWLNSFNIYVVQNHKQSNSLATKDNDGSSSKSEEKDPSSSGVVDAAGKNLTLSWTQRTPMRGDLTAFARTNCSTRPTMSSRSKLRDANTALDSLIREKGKISIAQFLSLHNYIQKGTNYIRLSVVSEVAHLYGESVRCKLPEKSISARRPSVNFIKRENSTNSLPSQCDFTKQPTWIV